MDLIHAFPFMKNKTVLIAISLTAIIASAMLLIMKKQADEAREVSNSIMQQFKTVDESLKRTNDSIENANDSIGRQMEKQFGTNK
jgi:uncharacterized secreted protein with C-terminal beta-propeller domain